MQCNAAKNEGGQLPLTDLIRQPTIEKMHQVDIDLSCQSKNLQEPGIQSRQTPKNAYTAKP
jgi:hypothetical protein